MNEHWGSQTTTTTTESSTHAAGSSTFTETITGGTSGTETGNDLTGVYSRSSTDNTTTNVQDSGGNRLEMTADGSRCIAAGYDAGVAAYDTSQGAQSWRRSEFTACQTIRTF